MKKLSILFALCSLMFFMNCNDEPLNDDFLDGSTSSCTVASENVVTAATNFLNATSENYSNFCNAYKIALQAQILACGDSVGALQEIIDSLGDCTEGADLCDIAQTAADEAEFAFNNATSENYTVLCNAYKTALENQIAACGDADGSLQSAIDVLGDCIEEVDPCDLAEIASEEAETAFNNATSETYTDLCNAYKTALENQIAACGDADGSLQNAIDALGDCIETVLDVQISVTAGTLDLEFDMVDVVENGVFLQITGTSTSNSNTIYFEVEDLLTGVDIVQNFVLTTTSDFFQSDQGPEPFTSNITINSQGVLQGTFSGLVTNADNADLSLTSGIININF